MVLIIILSQMKILKVIVRNNFTNMQNIENFYGTSKRRVDETIKNYDIIFDIDWQGTNNFLIIKS